MTGRTCRRACSIRRSPVPRRRHRDPPKRRVDRRLRRRARGPGRARPVGGARRRALGPGPRWTRSAGRAPQSPGAAPASIAMAGGARGARRVHPGWRRARGSRHRRRRRGLPRWPASWPRPCSTSWSSRSPPAYFRGRATLARRGAGRRARRDRVDRALSRPAAWSSGNRIASSSDVYGSFALVIGLLAWIYLGAQLMLVGAELNAVLTHRRGPGRSRAS